MTLPTSEQVGSFTTALGEAIQKVADKLSLPVSNLWDIGLKKQYIDGGFYLFIGMILIICLSYVIIKLIRFAIKNSDDGEMFGLCCFLSFISSIGILGGLFLSYNGALHIIIPQYTLIKEIMGLIGQ